jgi:hypothetical protein
MVAKALDEVPEEFDKEWDNVAVTVSTDWVTDEEDGSARRAPSIGNLLRGCPDEGIPGFEWFETYHRGLSTCTGIALRFG